MQCFPTSIFLLRNIKKEKKLSDKTRKNEQSWSRGASKYRFEEISPSIQQQHRLLGDTVDAIPATAPPDVVLPFCLTLLHHSMQAASGPQLLIFLYDFPLRYKSNVTNGS